jgi:hypothetical protein
MNRWMVALATLAFSFSLSPKTTSLSALSGFIFEGKVAALDGRPVPGAEIQLRDGSGELRHHVMSDLQGRYRFPIVLALAGETKLFRIDISHLRYQPVHVSDALREATISRLELIVPAPGQPVEVLASARRVQRDFVLTPSRGTPQHPTVGPVDPNYAEYCYLQAQQLLGQRRDKEAVELLKIYAQTGGNTREIARSLELIAEHDR